MVTEKGDLIQTIALSTDGKEKDRVCKGRPDQWCIFASVLEADTGHQLVNSPSRATAASPSQQVNMRYTFDANTGKVTQTVKLDGKVIDEMSTSSGKPFDFYTEIECQNWAHGLAHAHSYLYTTFRLNQPDMGWRDIINNWQTSNADPETHDGGKTWYVSWAHINETFFEVVSQTNSLICLLLLVLI
ncbi:hypothetical protein EJ08DRAFT_14270 [Tothia fuscella]|uniref:Uncharacterized protein n=1 Tax=Tothia fuscella TaxID=1048955 RepID=A0A9P4P607_9PEZI|nr:hypothetical protein EJ08DRAFT_14270 [Tothia fuscella]